MAVEIYIKYRVRTQSIFGEAAAMKVRPVIVIAVFGVAALVTLSIHPQAASAVSDPRQEASIVIVATAARVTGSERGFTGIIGTTVQSNFGFRVAGKIVERFANPVSRSKPVSS
jgi:hypothetical protein